MARHFSREARLSRLYANRIVLRAFITILLYCFAINLVVGYGTLFVLGYLTRTGVNMRRVISVALIVIAAEIFIYILVKLLLLKSEKTFRTILIEFDIMFVLSCVGVYLGLDRTLLLIIVAAASFVVSFIGDLIKFVFAIYLNKPVYYKKTLRALRHNRRVANAKVRMLHGLWRSLKYGQIPAGKTKEDVEREKEEVIRLLQIHRKKARDANHKVDSYKYFFIRNRYAKNEFTEIRYRRARKCLNQVENAFVVISSLFAFIFFAFITILSARLGDNQSLWDALNPKGTENSYIIYFYIAMGVIFFFHFLCAVIAGTVTRIKLWDHDTSYIDVNASAAMDGTDMNVYPEYGARKMSIQRRWDDSNAILEEKPREYKVTIFFLRNLVHVIFALTASVLFIYLTPALVTLSKQDSSFATIFKILNMVLIDTVTGAMYYALSTREYEYDCMDEHLMRWRYRHDAFMVFFILLMAGYLVLMLLGDAKALFESLVYSRMLVSSIMILVSALITFIVNLVMLPKEKKKRNKDVMVFSALDELANYDDGYNQYYNQ